MSRNKKTFAARKIIILLLVLINIIAIKEGYTGNEKWYWALILTLPLLLLSIADARRKKNMF